MHSDLIPLVLMTPDQVAERLGCYRETLATWRCHRTHIPFVHVEGLPRYAGEELANFLNRTLVGASATPISATSNPPLVHPIRLPLDNPAGAWHLTAPDLARLWQVKLATLSAWRGRKQGPAWIRHPLSGRPLYGVAELDHYLRERRTEILAPVCTMQTGPNRSAVSRQHRPGREAGCTHHAHCPGSRPYPGHDQVDPQASSQDTTAAGHDTVSASTPRAPKSCANRQLQSESGGCTAPPVRPHNGPVSTDAYPDFTDDTPEASSRDEPTRWTSARPMEWTTIDPRVNPGKGYTMEEMVEIGKRSGLTEDFIRSL